MEGYTYTTLSGTIAYNYRAYTTIDKLTVDGVEYAVYYINNTNIIYTVHYDDTNKNWVILSHDIDTNI